jgi:hypothetical protein
LIQYLINNELEILHADKSVKQQRIKLDLVQYSGKAYTLEELNELQALQDIGRSKIRAIPALSGYSFHKQVRPGFILNCMEQVA